MGREYEQGQVLSNLDERFFQAYFSLLYRTEKMKQFLYFYLLFWALSLPRPGYLLQSVVGERKRKVSFNCTAQVWPSSQWGELTCESGGVLVSPEVVGRHAGVITEHLPLH